MAAECGGGGGDGRVGAEGGEITYVSYGGEQHLPLVMSLVDAELSEPYSIFTYRYFVYLWPQLTFLAFDAKEGKCVGTVVCKMGEHRGAFRGYIAMLVVLKPYRGRGIGDTFLRLFTSCLLLKI
ncbi:N-alpha-acetyltransferase MAK3 [Dichanthelium oligosanthes]|uniref:N-alpha-acetyltransferase MAK3 n=1 Tax=Dichanthelium oligosanthes TaxID=888268 RepID=A0A1E5WEY7_9POAL|nr:N-alpha-acetyltransferase MAK3 [Dichanthelium oligosanthes]